MQITKKRSQFLPLAGASVVALAAIAVAPAPARADVAAVQTTVTSLAGISAGITTIVLGAMGVRMAIKLVNRVAVKG